MNNFGEKVTFIWSVADLLRDAFKRSKYPDVILPFTVLRRIDCVLEPTKQAVLTAHGKLKGRSMLPASPLPGRPTATIAPRNCRRLFRPSWRGGR